MKAVAIRDGDGRATRRKDAQALPFLLEFHSPTAALSQTPIQYGARSVIAVVCTMAVACFGTAGLIPVDKVVTAAGKVVSEMPNFVIQPLETSIVRSVDVREGQIVKAGTLLARLDATFTTADVSSLQAQVESLQNEVDRLHAEATGQPYRPEISTPLSVMQSAIFSQRAAERSFKMQNFVEKIGSLQATIQRAMSDVAGYKARLDVATTLERKRIELERQGVGSSMQRLSQTDSRLEVERGYGNAQAQAIQAARDLSAMQAERDGYDQTWRSQVIQELTEQGRKLSDAKENLTKALKRKQLVEMRAEQDSAVLNIAKVSPGAVMQSGEQLMTLTRVDAPLEVEVNISGTDAGFVHVGDSVAVKFDSFPAPQYGDAEGTVRVVSSDSFTANPDEKQKGVQQSTAMSGQSFYRARISIDALHLHDMPSGFRVVPGMPVQADIKVGKRTVLSYLLSRVLPIALDGMREP